MRKLVAVAVLAASPALCVAQNWKGEGDVAFNKTSGNSRAEALMAKLLLTYSEDRWTHTGEVEAVNTSEDDSRSGEYYVLKEKSDYALSETTYAFGGLRYEDNRFSGYEYQAAVKGGLGKHLINDGTTVFDVEGGIGYRNSKEQDTGETLNEAILVGSAKYHRELTATTRFESGLNVEAGKDNTFAEAAVALKVKINSSLALRVAYTAKHNTDVPVGTDNTDTLTSVGLNYSF